MADLQTTGGESVIGSWRVYTGEQGVNTAKVAGKLLVTEGNLYFLADLSLSANAAADISNGIKAFSTESAQLKIPLKDIRTVRIVRKFLILKSLEITIGAGEQKVFHFGAMSPQAACEAICARTGLIPA